LTFIDLRVADGVAALSINRPQTGNALNWALLEQLRSAVRQAIDAVDVAAIVISAAGSRFVSGADVGFFVRCLESGNLPNIVECIRASQQVFAEIAACPKPIVAAVGGAAVGGGVELALACHRIVATPRASFSFPETGLGILPFSGGTYRTPRRIGVPLTKWLVYTGQVVPPPKALALGLVDDVTMPDQLLPAAGALALSLSERTARAPHNDRATPNEFAIVESLFAKPLAELRAADSAGDRIATAALKSLATRPAVALEWSERLIDGAVQCSAEEGARAALEAVGVLFSLPAVRAKLVQVAAEQRRG
jgi:enoyl-CoA hydratase/carnithine racemase